MSKGSGSRELWDLGYRHMRRVARLTAEKWRRGTLSPRDVEARRLNTMVEVEVCSEALSVCVNVGYLVKGTYVTDGEGSERLIVRKYKVLTACRCLQMHVRTCKVRHGGAIGPSPFGVHSVSNLTQQPRSKSRRTSRPSLSLSCQRDMVRRDGRRGTWLAELL